MNTKKVNGFFGNALFIVGAVKIIFMVMVLIQLLAGINSIFNGGSADFGYSYLLSMLIGGSQFILAIASIVMIIVNTKNQPEVIPGYLIGLGAVAIEIFAPSFITIIALLTSCGMYMKAGTYIREKNKNYEPIAKTSKQTIKNTEWFYSDPNEQNKKIEQMEMKKQKRMAKLEKELSEWKELLDSGEVDYETYKQETDKLIEKEKRRSERI